MQQGQIPAQELAEGFLLALAGALLLTPGFVTDAFGFFLLVPVSRQMLVHKVIAFMKPRMMTGGFQANGGFQSGHFNEGHVKDVYAQEPEKQERITIIEGEYSKEENDK